MTSKHKKVTSIILNYNKSEETIKLYQQLAEQTYPSHEILVVDNCSDVDQQQHISAAIPKKNLINSLGNKGFSGGMNIGIKSALDGNAGFVWLLNNDVRVGDIDALSKMIELFRIDEKFGVVSPLIKEPETGEVNFSGGYYDNTGWTHRTNDPDRYAEWLETYPEQIWLAGTALLIKREVFDHVGLLEEKYFMYWEDNDFCFRANQAGLVCRIAQNTEVYHHDTPWEHRPPYYHYYMARNEILFMRHKVNASYKSVLWAIENRIQNNISVLTQYGCRESVDATYRGIWDGLIGKTGKAEDFSAPPAIVKGLGRLLSWYGARQRARGRG